MEIPAGLTFSASQINTWLQCHRAWYNSKILNKRIESPYFDRGTIVHECIEKASKTNRAASRFYDKHKLWKKLPEEMKKEVIEFLFNFDSDCKLPSTPIYSEYKLINKEYEMRGFIDAVGIDYIIDYKTSKFYDKVPEDYWRQLKIYCLLYYLQTNIFIPRLGVYYLKYNRIEWITIKKSDLKKIGEALKWIINDIKQHILNDDFESTCGDTWCDCRSI